MKEFISDYGLPVARVCALTGLARSKYYYKSCKEDSDVITALQPSANKHPVYGFRKLFACLKRDDKQWNHKKVYQVYKLLKLNKKSRGKRRLPDRVKRSLQEQVELNSSWSMDFMSDSLASGSKVWSLSPGD
ncbi:MAG: IS3 family transposase [Adhaeribacter sp.]